MQLTHCGYPSGQYSQASDYAYDQNHEVVQNTRRPLGKPTGNIQPHSPGPVPFRELNHIPFSPSLHPVPTLPILPAQSITSTYGTGFQDHGAFSRGVSLRESSLAQSRRGQNPIYSHKNFADYRAKVLQKEQEKEEPAWPMYLEDAFLDALLLIPFMGRKKVSAKGQLYGRNMLVSEYLWICHLILFPPQPGEDVPMGKKREQWKQEVTESTETSKDGKVKKGAKTKCIAYEHFRTRKQVSSHIQVLKKFFEVHPCFHFFFPRKNDLKDDDREYKEEEGAVESFKNNKVLLALAEGRLPDERPNYEYFACLLAAELEVFVEPKTCWIYVSSTEVTLSPDYRVAHAGDGSVLKADAYTPEGQRLDSKGDYPHLTFNGNTDVKKALRSGRDGEPLKHLLHQYTKDLKQKEATSIKEVSKKWERNFPELRENLLSALDETHPSHEWTARSVMGPCDTIHLEVALDLHATSRFPSGTHLEGSVQLTIKQLNLTSQRWRSVTSISKPRQLEHEGNEVPFWNRVNTCDPVSCQKDIIEVPFPAKSWASIFFRLSAYVQADRDRKDRRDKVKKKAVVLERSPSARKQQTDNNTVNELLQQVAMYQEIWSSPDNRPDNPVWTRRAIILWTFLSAKNTTGVKGNKSSTAGPVTSWRFLTKVDPMSQLHQQRALLSGSPQVRGLSRNTVMSPNPAYTTQLHNAAMHENFNNVGYESNSRTMTLHDQLMHSYTYANGVVDNFSTNSLATPTPTASLSSSYAHSFDNATIASTDSLGHHMSFVSDGPGADSHDTLVAGDSDHSNPDLFLASLGVPVASTAYDEDPSVKAWATQSTSSLSGLDQWATAYVDSQHSLAWPDQTLGVGADDVVSSRNATPWSDGNDILWAATDDATSDHATVKQNDAWAAATSQAWLQSIADTTGASTTGYDYDNSEHHEPCSRRRQHNIMGALNSSSSFSRYAPSEQPMIPSSKQSNNQGPDTTSEVAVGRLTEQTGSQTHNRKRTWVEGDETDEDRKKYPCLSICKSAHDYSINNRVPEANMLEEEHGLSFQT